MFGLSVKSSAKLYRALEHYEHRDVYNRTLTRSAILELAGFRFFSVVIAEILGKNVKYVTKVSGAHVNPNTSWPKFSASSLDALACVAVQYEDDGYVNGKMVRLIVQNGTDLNMVAYLTGITLEELRIGIKETS